MTLRRRVRHVTVTASGPSGPGAAAAFRGGPGRNPSQSARVSLACQSVFPALRRARASRVAAACPPARAGPPGRHRHAGGHRDGDRHTGSHSGLVTPAGRARRRPNFGTLNLGPY